jgi:hypothetical protein
MIPDFDERGNLPPGIHTATWDELVARYGTSARRLTQLAGLKRALDSLRVAGCQRAYVDGSFVADKDDPQDFDACWEVAGVDPGRLDPELLDFTKRRAAQKATYGGELFPAESGADPAGTRFIDYFQQDKTTGEPKGIVALDLGDLP